MTGWAGSAGSTGATGAVRSVVGSVAMLVAACLGTAAAAGAPAGAGPAGVAARFAPVPGPYAVEAMNLDWFDRDRNRQVPVRVYFPRREPGPFPVVLFSSGLGAGRNNLEFLGRHLASHGYVSVHVQHLGDDGQPVAGGGNAGEALLKAARDPRAGLTRLLDLVFALDQVGALAAGSPVLRGRIDLGAVAVGGNHLGAWTALAAAGLATVGKDGEESSLPDPRVKAALLLFPPPAVAQSGRMRFELVKVPCLHVIGVPAGGGETESQAAARRITFDRIAGADQVLVTVTAAAAAAAGAGAPAAARAGAGAPTGAGATGTDRTVNAAGRAESAAGRNESATGRGESAASRGTGAAPAPGRDPAMQDHLKAITAAFLDAYLRHDAAAKSWVAGGGLAAYLGDGCRVETRSR